MEFVPLLVLAVMVKKIIDWARVLIPKHYHSRVMIPVSWLVGIVVVLLFGASEQLSGGVEVWSGLTLNDADVYVKLVYGFAVGATGGVVHDFVKPTTPPHDELPTGEPLPSP